ncbi:biotin/lipoyl-binding protein, partial [Campylobacter jejuni]
AAFFSSPPPPTFAVAEVVRGNLEDSVLASGTMDAVERVSVGAQASGQLKSLKVALGDRVKKGQLVAE